MRRPTVSVLMNCLNGARYLTEALDSVYRQSYDEWEIIFWDDASTDQSAAIAHSYDSRLRYCRGLGGSPLGASRNFALAQCRGRYVALLDCDDTWESDRLQRHVQDLARHPRVGMVWGDCWIMDAESHRRRRTFYQQHPSLPANTYRGLLTGRNFIPAPTLMWDVEVMRRIGGFSPRLRYAETYELCVRMAVAADSFTSGGWPVASYRIHPGNRGGTGCRGMTREVLMVLDWYRGSAGWRQYLREGLLWARYGGQCARGA